MTAAARAWSLLLACPVGFEDLVRGDLLQEHRIRTSAIGHGVLLAEPVSRIGFLDHATAIDRVSVPLHIAAGVAAALRDAGAEDLCRLAGVGRAISFRVHSPADPGQRDEVITEVSHALGWVNSAGDWDVNVDLTADRADIGRLRWAARFGHLDRLPAATPVAVAACAVRLAKVPAHGVLLDPCAGVGTIPIVDALVRPAGSGMALDTGAEAVLLAHGNARRLGLGDRVASSRGDATGLDLADHSVDRVVADLPFGKRVGSNEVNRRLYPAMLREVERVLSADGRCVLLTDDKRIFTDSVARTRGLKVVREHLVRYNGVTPTAYVLTRSRKVRRH